MRRFVRFYGGAPDSPKPFAGRKAELKRLDAWLANLEAEPNLLLTAPAGRGKSMLLVQWLARVDATDLDLVFVPISLRYGTNRAVVFLEALAARLAKLLDEDLPPPLLNPFEHFKDKATGYLARLPRPGRRCLVVVDGLDEATGGEIDTLLPAHPPKGLRILLSARETALLDAEGWSGRVGWTLEHALARRETIPPLDADGAGALLDANGIVLDRPTRRDVVAALVDPDDPKKGLTQGDPLLLQLYAEDLAGRQAKGEVVGPGMLAGLKPGYGAYFQDWFRRQEAAWAESGRHPADDRWKAVLAVLAGALGPLLYDDLAGLAKRVLERLAEIDKDVIALVQRFVLNDGLSLGYVLAHPRLAAFLMEKGSPLVPGSWVARAQRAFLDWGGDVVRRLNHSKLDPSETPEYLLKFYGQHLSDKKKQLGEEASPESFLELVENGWRLAWKANEDGYRGFANDLHLVWRALKGKPTLAASNYAGADTLVGQIKCVLCLSSISSTRTNIPPSLLGRCVECEIVSVPEALYFAGMQNFVFCAKALAAVAPLVTPEDQYAKTLASAVAGALTKARALKVGSHARALMLSDLAPLVPEEQRAEVLTDALAAAWAVQYDRAEVLADALAAARTAYDSSEDKVADWLGHVAPDLLERALRPTPNVTHEEHYRAEALVRIAPHLPQGMLNEVLCAARAIDDTAERAKALTALVQLLPESRRGQVLADALADVKTIDDPITHADMLADLAPLLPEGHRAEAVATALAAAKTGHDNSEYEYAKALEYLAPFLPGEQGVAALTDVFARLSTEDDDWGCAGALVRLAPHLPESMQDEALRVAQTIGDAGHRAKALIALVRRLPESRRAEALADALAAAKAHKRAAVDYDEWWQRFTTFAALAPLLSEDLLADALASTQEIADEHARVTVLIALAAHLPNGIRYEALTWALTAARSVIDNVERALALAKLAPLLPRSQYAEAVAEALAAVLTVIGERPSNALEPLAALTPHLSDEQLDEALAAVPAVAIERSSALSSTGQIPEPEHSPDHTPESEEIAVVRIGHRGHDSLSLSVEKLQEKASIPTQHLSIPDDSTDPIPELEQASTDRLLFASYDRHSEAGWLRARVLALVAPRLSDDRRVELLTEGLAAAEATDNPLLRAEALAALTPSLPEDMLDEALRIAEAIGGERDQDYAWEIGRAEALTALVPRVPKGRSTEILTEAFATAKAIGGENFRVLALARLSPHLPPDLLEEVLYAARGTNDSGYRARALAQVASLLPVEERVVIQAEALLAACDAPDVAALTQLATQLAPELHAKALDKVRTIANAETRGLALSILIPYYSGAILQEAFDSLIESWSHAHRRAVLNQLGASAVILAQLGGKTAVRDTYNVVRAVTSWWP